MSRYVIQYPNLTYYQDAHYPGQSWCFQEGHARWFDSMTAAALFATEKGLANVTIVPVDICSMFLPST